MPIKVICFDADGVIVNPQMQFSQLLRLHYGITPEMTKPFFDGVFNECLVGKADLMDVLPPFLRMWKWNGSVEEFIDLWLRTDHVIDAKMFNAIIELRLNGFICCLATSQEQHRADYMKKEMGFKPLFDHMFFSCEIGAQKPDAAYYQHIEKRLQMDSQSILFWDDRIQNVSGARACGWNGEVYVNYEKFLSQLSAYSLA
jgi:putative hydrolase of the HAD superfamily